MLRHLTPLQIAVCLMFVVGSLTVFALAAAMLTRHAIEVSRGLRRPHRRRFIWFRRVVYGLACLGAVCVLYGYAVEPYWLQLTHLRFTSARVSLPVRIVLLADTHCDGKVRLEERLPREVRAQAPDVVLFAGDALGAEAGLADFRKCMRRLAQIAPTYAVEGNWDRHRWTRLDIYRGTGVRVLDGEAVRLGETTVWVAGAPWRDRRKIHRAAHAVPKGRYTVFLTHSPGDIGTVSRRGADLCLVGHTHGGQIALPFYGALITLCRTGKRYERGLHRVDSTWLYVNCGLGLEGGIAPRVRFGCRPELTVIDLAPE